MEDTSKLIEFNAHNANHYFKELACQPFEVRLQHARALEGNLYSYLRSHFYMPSNWAYWTRQEAGGGLKAAGKLASTFVLGGLPVTFAEDLGDDWPEPGQLKAKIKIKCTCTITIEAVVRVEAGKVTGGLIIKGSNSGEDPGLEE